MSSPTLDVPDSIFLDKFWLRCAIQHIPWQVLT